jgi:hypothetical protein
MNSDERQLISGLFDRMRNVGPLDKDRDAEAMIKDAVRQMPDAPYLLVQSVLVQEHTLQQAGARIEELEERVRSLEAQASRAPQQASGSFLGGLFGGGAKNAPAPLARGSVPAMGGRPMGAPAGSPWGQPQQAGYGAPMAQPAPASGGGFMKSAMATAAGVAGGMLLADSIRGMMGGHSGAGHGQSAAASPASDAGSYDPNASTADSTQSAQYQDPGQYEADNYEQASDDGSDFGGGDVEI